MTHKIIKHTKCVRICEIFLVYPDVSQNRGHTVYKEKRERQAWDTLGVTGDRSLKIINVKKRAFESLKGFILMINETI
ncbi:hypothetical protein BpHYR1_013562 [Brachionus plicatilis]|uniref:Uncharacterized protein n=1 Tax=Brachionus plicatilis TaxID=10195 RepID=A0A3M7T815_BRAPC|nr:hypothetical protein BpHYR1_013562 [Brachionus plicatilis]